MPPTTEDQKDVCRGTEDTEAKDGIHVHTSEIAGEDECYFIIYTPAPLFYIPPRTNEYGAKTTGKQSKLQCSGTNLTSSHAGATVVRLPHLQMEWEDTFEKRNIYGHRLGCIPLGEQALHINCLEFLTVTLAIKTFVKNESKLLILLRIDNTTVVAYTNNLGGTVSTELAKAGFHPGKKFRGQRSVACAKLINIHDINSFSRT